MSVIGYPVGEKRAGRYYGVLTGEVTDNKDPKALGRVRVKLGFLPGDFVTTWARVASPSAGKDRGICFLPEVGDEVLVAFAHGDPDRPYVVGSLWSDKVKPLETNGDGKNNRRVVQSRSGHKVILDDTEGEERITLEAKGGKAKIELDSKSGDIALTIGGEVLTLSGSGGAITARTSAGLTLDLQKLVAKLEDAAQIDATKVEIKAKAGIALQCMAGIDMNSGALKVT